MCSILGIFELKGRHLAYRELALELSGRLRHRGPDWTGIYSDQNAVIAHERLSIVDVDSGSQPLVSRDGNLFLAANAEIYNHRQLEADLEKPYPLQTGSDCEVILPLYQQEGAGFLHRLNGIFAFVLWDRKQEQFFAARDPIGVVPLYYGWDELGQLYFASELKALTEVCTSFRDFPPGHYMSSSLAEPQPYYRPRWKQYENTKGRESG